MKLITDNNISISELTNLAEQMYGDMVKAVVDIKTEALVVGVEMHVDGEQYLLEHGAKLSNLWGINLYPSRFGNDNFIEFDSMINIRPSQNNRTRTIEDAQLRTLITELVTKKVVE